MKIANIINFVRAVEPRVENDDYLPVTLAEELKLCNKYNFKSTVLLQYDALINEEYIDIIKQYGENAEIGLWLEIVKPLVEDCGMEWRGRYSWDWRNDVGFLIGYKPEERIKLIDMAFEIFKSTFGFYPKSVGSWHIDAFSLNYMKEKYSVVASCNCKDQYGTDGYTIWGGYYNGAYYPSKTNMLCPANKKENQINVPVFRMLGSDPIHQYDLGLGELNKGQSVMSLEPVYGNSGADKDWVKWFLKEMFNDKCLAMSYAQFGQENSFGWHSIEKGLKMQFELLDEMVRNGETELLTLAETGERFIEKFESTPATSLCIDSDCLPTDYKTLWYMSKFYRVNLLYDNGKIKIRDIHIFDNDFKEKYLEKSTKNNECFFSNVPLIDGFRFSSKEKTAGGYFYVKDEEIVFDGEYVSKANNNTALLNIGEDFSAVMSENSLEIKIKTPSWRLCFKYNKYEKTEYIILNEKELEINFMGHNSFARLDKGVFVKENEEFSVIPEDGIIKFKF